MKTKYRIIIMAVLCLILLLLPLFVSNDYVIILLDQTLISIIILIGFNFITGLMGEMNLGIAGIMAMGAYTSAILTTKLSMSPWLALIFAVLMGFIIGVGLGYPSLRYQRDLSCVDNIGVC